MRVGIGYDSHRLVPDRPLVIGGITIPYEFGLAGHSDADVLAHAISDALLGAAGLGDIGQHFPDTDPRYKDADSLILLAEIVGLLERANLRIGNVDATLAIEQPKIEPYRSEIAASLAAVLGLDLGCINLKATTGEGIGFIGRQEGVAALAVVALIEDR